MSNPIKERRRRPDRRSQWSNERLILTLSNELEETGQMNDAMLELLDRAKRIISETLPPNPILGEIELMITRNKRHGPHYRGQAGN